MSIAALLRIASRFITLVVTPVLGARVPCTQRPESVSVAWFSCGVVVARSAFIILVVMPLSARRLRKQGV
jgi:hypothetical protein